MKKRDVSLNTDAHRAAFNDFADLMRAVESREGWRSSEVLTRVVDAAYLAVRGRLLLGDAFEKNEAEYMKIVGACSKPKETMTDIARMLGCVTLALRAEPIDFIGPVFEALSASAEMGQFFTPYHLSVVMARMILGDPKAVLGDRRFLTLHEPACGVGGMILATNVVLREAGLDVARQAHWSAIDVDYRAHRACYLQLALTDCSADVYRGNALGSLDELRGDRTPTAILFPKIQRDSAPPTPAAHGGQLSLF